MTQLILSDHNSFNNFFRDFLDGKIADDVVVRFQETTAMSEKPFLRVQGEDYNGTVNATVMEALLSYQKNINKLYSLISYGKVQRLKDDELEAIRVIFNVDEGSSIFDDINKDKILETIMSKVTGKQITAVVVLGLLLYFTSDGVKYYLDKQYNQQDKELILQVIREVKGGTELLDGHKDFSAKLKKLSKQADSVEYSGYQIDAEPEKIDDKLVTHKQLNGSYRVLKLDAENDSYFRVRVENISTGNKFNAKLDQIISQPADLEMLYRAIFNRKDVHLDINARFIDNKLADAFVVSITELETKQAQPE